MSLRRRAPRSRARRHSPRTRTRVAADEPRRACRSDAHRRLRRADVRHRAAVVRCREDGGDDHGSLHHRHGHAHDVRAVHSVRHRPARHVDRPSLDRLRQRTLVGVEARDSRVTARLAASPTDAPISPVPTTASRSRGDPLTPRTPDAHLPRAAQPPAWSGRGSPGRARPGPQPRAARGSPSGGTSASNAPGRDRRSPSLGGPCSP